jgi:uncharacterized protein YjbJ (UPF0337 family)
MSLPNKDEVKGKVDQAKGNIKEKIGRATNDPDLVDEGLSDQAKGNLREGVGTARRKVGDAIDDIKDKIKH